MTPSRARGTDALAPVRDYRDRGEHLIVGLLSGTSADAIDAALVRVRGVGFECTGELVAYREEPFDEALRREVLDVAAAPTLEPERLMTLDAALGERFAVAALDLLGAARVNARDVDAIGSHGQTVRHVPRRAGGGEALTLQLGSAAILAERTGLTVVSGFRNRDTAAGGEGAPLVPVADWWLFRSADESRALLNLGGMANLTHLPRGVGLDGVLAFDTGPGNVLSDALMRLDSGGAVARDEGGGRALSGTASEALLLELLADPFFAETPPRSTGRERFGDRYAARVLEMGRTLGLADHDVLATAVELTAASVADAVELYLAPRGGVDAVYASGGGVRNAALMAALERRLAPARVEPLERLGFPADAKEAVAFAFLAHLTLSGLPGNVIGATGAKRAVVLGQVTPGEWPGAEAV